MRILAAKLLLDHRVGVEALLVAAALVAFLLTTGAAKFDTTLDPAMRADLYNALSGTAGTLLGFVLAALAVLVALPSSERVVKLQEHPGWPLVPSTYFRASRALLAGLLFCLLGLPLDSGASPWIAYEAVVVVVLSLSLVRVAGAAVALDQILAVAAADKKKENSRTNAGKIEDPGP